MRRLTSADLERFVAASPLRVRLVDMHTQTPPLYPVSVRVERVDPDGPRSLDVAYKVISTGVVSFVGLAQSHTAVGSTDFRIRAEANGTISETDTGAEWLEVSIATWTSAAPPAVLDGEFRFYPSPSYGFAPGIAILAGRVVDAAASAVAGAAVSRSETVDGQVRVEACRTDELGNFRLPLRWSQGATTVTAEHAGDSGTVDVDVPDDLTTQVRIEIS